MPSQTVAHSAPSAAILCEVVGTALPWKSEPFARGTPTPALAALFAGTCSLMTHALKVMPLGIVDALRSGGVAMQASSGAAEG